MNAPAMAIFDFVLCLAVARGQVTWGPQPMYMSDTDDFSNQQRLYELLRQAYFTDYTAQHQQHRLAPAMTAELAEFQQKAMASPALALAVAMGKYHFAWYHEGAKEMDVDSIRDASELMALSIQSSTTTTTTTTRTTATTTTPTTPAATLTAASLYCCYYATTTSIATLVRTGHSEA